MDDKEKTVGAILKEASLAKGGFPEGNNPQLR